jgi:hypothetical protein
VAIRPIGMLAALLFFTNRQLANFFIGIPAPFFKKTVALCLEKTGGPVYLQIIRTKLVLIMIIIRKNAGLKRFTAF